MTWLDSNRKDFVENLVDEFLAKLNELNDLQLEKAIVSRLAERMFEVEPQDDVSQLRRQKRADAKESGQTHSRTFRRQG